MQRIVLGALVRGAREGGHRPAPAAAAGWRWPVDGPVITQYRNGDDPYARGQHRGIDIAAPVGTPVVAATGGAVTYAGVAGSSGLTIAVQTSDGRLETSYLHLSSIAVRAGSSVAAGDRLGAVGTTGRRSAAEPHLHFGVRDAGDRFGYHDPLDFLPAPPPPGPRVPRPVPVPAVSPAPADPVAAPAVASASSLGAGAAHPAGRAGARTPGPALGLIGFTPVHAAGSAHPQTPSGSSGRGFAAARADRGASVAPPHGRRAAQAGSAAPEPMAGPRAATNDTTPAVAAPHRSNAHVSSAAKHGIDAGWLAACAGLVVAAIVLGKPRGPAAAGRQCRSLLLGAVRPVRQ